MKNLKVSKNIKALALTGVMVVAVGFGIENYNFLGLNKTQVEVSSDVDLDIDSYTYFKNSDLVALDDIKQDLESRRLFVEKFVVTDITKADDRLKFEIDNVLLSKEEVKDYIGLVNYSKDVNFILYKVSNENGVFLIEKVITNNLNVEGQYYVDPDNCVELIDPEKGYCFNGKIRQKE